MNKRGHSAFSTTQKKRNVPNKERGLVLVSVIIAITLVAAIAFALSQQGASETNVTSGELERDHLRYVAEAGMAHARLQLAKNTSCSGYTDIPKTDFGVDSYKAKFKTAEGSPVTVVATGSMGSSAEFTLQSDAVRAYQPPTTVVSQLSKTAGKDTMIDHWYDRKNFGTLDNLTVRSDPTWMQRPLLEFDLSAIPAGVKIISAQLELEQLSLGNPGVIGVHRITRSWLEGSQIGAGTADGASWVSYDGASPWAHRGGDFASTLYAATTTTSVKNGQPVTWDIRGLVDEWVSGEFPNYGLILVGDGVVDNAGFQSREGLDPTSAPKLTIAFACECGKICPGGVSKNLLLIVGDAGSLTSQESAKKSLIESWNYTVNLIDDSDTQTNFDTAIATNDVAYLSGEISASELGTKLTASTKGIVNEQITLHDELGFSSSSGSNAFNRIFVEDNAHSITDGFATGWLTIATTDQTLNSLEGTLAPGLQNLATVWISGANYNDGLALLEVGAELYAGGNAAGRRAQLPWGVTGFDLAALNANGQTIMRRAIEWGARGPQENPVAHWKFDDGAGLTALDSEGGHDGTLLNGPAWVPGKLDTALDFDGSDDVVDVPQTSDLDLSTFTVTAWIKISALTSSQTILEKRDGADLATVNYVLLAAGNEITWAFYDGGWASFSTDAANMEVDTWYHVAGTYDNSTGEGNVYVNGVLLAAGTTTKNPPLVPGTVRIGDSECAACLDKWNGSLDDVRIYNRALSASEVADLFDTGSGAGYYLDEFNSLNCDPASDYTGSDGSRDWSGWQWQETLDDSGSCSGDIKILVDGGSNRLQLKGDGSGIERRVDLTAFSVATLSFDYLQDGPFDATRYLSVWASADAGSNWTEVGRIDVEGDGTYKSASFDISAHVGPNAMIRFETADLQATRKIYIDNVHIDDVPTGGGGGGGEVTFEEFTDASLSSDGLSITIPKPAGTAAGDLLIAAIVTDGENKPAMMAPAGWTLIDHDKTSKQVTMDVLWKIADASEPGSYDFSWAKIQEAYGWIMRFTGHDPTTPIHDSQSDGGTSSSPVSPAVSTTIANTMIVRIGGFDDDDITPGDPGLSGHTAVTMGASDTGTGTASGGAGYVLQSGTGDSGTSTFSLTNSEEYRAVTIAIAPAP